MFVDVIASEYEPLAVNDDAGKVTSTQLLRTTAPTVPAWAPRTGLLFQVIVVSDHVAVTANTVPPTGLASVVYSRSFAAVAGEVSPATVNRRYVRYSGFGARTWSVVVVPAFLLGADDETLASATLVKVEVAARAGDAVREVALQPISSATATTVAAMRIGRNGWGRALRGSCLSRADSPSFQPRRLYHPTVRARNAFRHLNSTAAPRSGPGRARAAAMPARR